MSIKVCGHQVRWQKPIKLYTLVKTLCLLMAVNMVFVTTVSAADFAGVPKNSKASSGDAVSCVPLHTSMNTNALHKAASARTQRSAGPSSMSPAMMLALALGYRNISGPVVRTSAHTVATKPVKPQNTEAVLIQGEKESIPSYASIIPSAGGTD